jgi:hypothetical protein
MDLIIKLKNTNEIKERVLFKNLNTDCFLGAVIRIPIEEHFAGDYRLEYDSKYITLFGKDRNYEGFRFSDDQPIWHEEMVLISCVLEVRNATPTIKEVTDTEIIVDLGCV